MTTLTRIELLGLEMSVGETADALDAVMEAASGEEPVRLAFANAHTLNLVHDDDGYRDLLNQFTFVFNDGIGVALGCRMRGLPVVENLNGTDFTPLLLRRCADAGWPVYLLGARPGIAERAAEVFRREIPALEIAGIHHGYFRRDDTGAIVRAIRESGARVLITALGNPRQERWIAEHAAASGVSLAVGVGALLDYTADAVRRAPGWMSRCGIEWLWRIAQEPRRLWRRYVIGNPLFLSRVLREGRRRRRQREAGGAA